MKTENIQYIQSIFGRHLDAEILAEAKYLETDDNMFVVAGEQELILECVIDLYNTLYNENPEAITKYIISTNSYNGEMLLTINDVEND